MFSHLEMTLTLSLQLIAALQLTQDTILFILFQDVLAGFFAMSLLKLHPKHHQIKTLKTYSRNRKCNVTKEKQKALSTKVDR